MWGAKRIYLAGPDVFRMDAYEEGARLAGIVASDAVVANLSPFRGPHMDPGTAMEIGYAVALKKPVFGWSKRTDPLYLRIRHRHVEIDELRIDEENLIVEDFGLAENLMIAKSLASLHPSPEVAIAAAAQALKRR